VIATKAAVGAADPRKDITMATNDDPDFEPVHDTSPTDHVLTELQFYGHRPFQDEPDPRPLPEAQVIAGAVVDIFDALVATLGDTRLEPDLENLLWSTVNLFHRSVERIEAELDDNERAQHRSQREQNGSEVRSVELERLIAQGLTLIERRNVMELFRDLAADRFEVHTGSAWRPRTGSMVNHRALTAAMIDSREFLAARRRAETELLVSVQFGCSRGAYVRHSRPRSAIKCQRCRRCGDSDRGLRQGGLATIRNPSVVDSRRHARGEFR